jgi:hypothetical protein
VLSPEELQAKANALSASAKTSPPWQIPWPLTMSGPIRIVTVARPGPQDSIDMPSRRDAESPRHRASTARSATRCLASGSGTARSSPTTRA